MAYLAQCALSKCMSAPCDLGLIAKDASENWQLGQKYELFKLSKGMAGMDSQEAVGKNANSIWILD